MKRVVFYLILFTTYLFGQEITLLEEYFLLLNDLSNANTIGYKSHLINDDIDRNNIHAKYFKKINFGQGSLIYTNRDLDFAIIGDGFFKVKINDENDSIGYTRNGEFAINRITNELITINGFKLFDTITIIPGFTKLIIDEDYSIITFYSNNEVINNGYLKIYSVDTDNLVYPENYEHLSYFLYFGEEEYNSNSRILNNMLECSNVDKMAIIMRLMEINKTLGMNFEENNNE